MIDKSKTDKLLERFDFLTAYLSDPSVTSDPAKYAELSKEIGALTPQVEAIRKYEKRLEDIEDILAILKDNSDPEMHELANAELAEAKDDVEILEKQIMIYIAPKDPRDNKSVIMEIRAGAGGEESALFAGDLLKMYSGYAASKGFKINKIDESPSGLGGYKEVVVEIEGFGAYSRFKFESGVHRVQRVPVTESGGRVHTSTATVAVLPEAEATEVKIDPKDLKIDRYRSSGAGGQHINKTSSAIRITHLPTGMVVTCQDERSQIQNKEKAMAVLQSRLMAIARDQDVSSENDARRSQVGTGDRSERIRTYNYHQGRVTDHRIGLTLYRLESILAGDLDEIIDALTLAAAAGEA
ncbi:MAG: peptide chain release factor 1 [Saccharofermentans sp.]|nr:peptide chain release factor 1 [Saccharofermentans sp.]